MIIQAVGGLLVFVLDVWAIASIFNSTAETNVKVLWIAIVVLLPFLGFLIWLFAGPKPAG